VYLQKISEKDGIVDQLDHTTSESSNGQGEIGIWPGRPMEDDDSHFFGRLISVVVHCSTNQMISQKYKIGQCDHLVVTC
jgi:hypothetical protein